MDKMSGSDLIGRAIGLEQGTGYIDVITLSKGLGIDVYLDFKREGENFNGSIKFDKSDNKYKIFVNGTQPIERQRFSIAHELAHFVLHQKELNSKGKLNRDPEDAKSKVTENQADELAAEVLMPESLIEQYAQEVGVSKIKPINKNIINNIAQRFKVSGTVAAIRLRSLKYFVPFISFA